MLANLNGWHLVIILAVVFLLFGATKLPALTRSVTQSMRIIKSETQAAKTDAAASTVPGEAAVTAEASAAATTKTL